GPSRRLHLFLCDVPGKVEGGTTVGDVTFFAGQQGNRITAVALVPQQKETFLHITNAGRAELIFAPRRETLRCKVVLWQGDARDLPRFAALLKASPAPASLGAWTKPGTARWTKPIVTRGQTGRNDAPFVIDTLTVPYDNPH